MAPTKKSKLKFGHDGLTRGLREGFHTIHHKLGFLFFHHSCECEAFSYTQVESPLGDVGFLMYFMERVYSFDDKYEVELRYSVWLDGYMKTDWLIGKLPDA